MCLNRGMGSSFLEAKGLFGRGIDCRITAFFNPARKAQAISKKVVDELDKAAVEIVSTELE